MKCLEFRLLLACRAQRHFIMPFGDSQWRHKTTDVQLLTSAF